MKVLTRTEFGNPILRKKSKNVSVAFLKTQKFKILKKEMIYTMRRTHGVGLAAPQIGKPVNIAIMEMRPTPMRPYLDRKGPIVIINPQILTYSKEKESDWEGCLSLGNVRARASRSKKIKVSYLNEEGDTVIEIVDGFWARIFQHEVDHLNGILFVDRIDDTKSFMSLREFRKRILKKK